MEQTVLQSLKGSEKYRIIAAVLEIMEKAQFESSSSVELKENKEKDIWEMSFVKRTTNLDELIDVKTELGDNFNIRLEAKNNSQMTICLEAPNEDFMKLIGKKTTPAKTQTIFDNQEGAPGEPAKQ